MNARDRLPESGAHVEPPAISGRERRRATDILRLGPRSALVLAIASLVGILGFCWPLLLPIAQQAGSGASHSADAPWLIVGLLPLLAGVVLAQVAEGGMDAKVVSLLGMLVAVQAGLRALSPGAGGLELGFFMLLLAGYAFGPGFGFVLGALGIFAGGLLTGGIGPWLPFQMFASAWVGLLGGLLPGRGRRPGWLQVGVLAGTALVAGLGFGMLMNLWFWPFLAGDSAVSYLPAGTLAENWAHFLRFWLVSSLGWDLPRGILGAVMVIAFGRPLLAAFARVTRKAAFGVRPRFEPRE